MAYRKLQFKSTGSSRATEVIQAGELAIDESTNRLYVGDGSTTGGLAVVATPPTLYTKMTVASSEHDASLGETIYCTTGTFDINAPATPAAGDWFLVLTNTGYTGTKTVKDSGGSSIVSLGAPAATYIVYDGSAWKYIET